MDLDTLREICLAHPGATEEVQWVDHLLFKVGGKMFCITALDDAGSTAFKVADDDFEELSATDIFIPAPHMARAKWVKVVKPGALKITDWKARIAASYELVKAKLPKKVIATLDRPDVQ
jgi:predicted DNA-binding protein (MmcQ/YjbR family)